MNKPDCLRCGLCCCAPAGQDSFCDVAVEDRKRLPRKFKLQLWHPSIFDHVIAATENATYPHAALKTRELDDFTACVALEGIVGREVKCAIYVRRPIVCQEAVKPGGKTCRSLRKICKEDLHG